MAGVRQHILPQFLLKGFCTRTETDDTAFTWVYRKDGKPFKTNVTKIGVEKYFYGRGGEVNVDDEITALEGVYAHLCNELRKGNNGELHDPKIPELIAHLSVRTKHFRDSFHESSEFLIDKLSEYLQRPDNLKKAILNKPELIKEKVEKVFADKPIPRPQKDILEQQLISMFITSLDEQQGQYQQLVQILFTPIKAMITKAVKEGHIKALIKAPAPELRAKDLKSLKWFISKSDIPLILGDMMCLFETAGPKRFKSLNDKSDAIKNVYLPIASDRMLVGTSLYEIPQMDFNVINEAIAKCSKEFFICSESSTEIMKLLSLIGIESDIISKEELERIANQLDN